VTFTRTKKVTERVTKKVTENQRKILNNIKENSNITTQELSKKVGISDRKIKDNIKKLKENNLLKRIGSPRGGYWEVVEK
jgi:ATP-dependent DNA helicase RecG